MEKVDSMREQVDIEMETLKGRVGNARNQKHWTRNEECLCELFNRLDTF